MSLGINLIREIANKRVKIPVLGWLWEHVIAPGRPLTLLNVCCLVIPMPTTVLYKAKKKSAPPKLAHSLTKDGFRRYLDGQGNEDLAAFNMVTASSLELIAGEFDALALLADGAFEGTGLESIPVGFVSDLMGILDSASLIFESLEGFVSWPVHEKESGTVSAESFDLKKFCKYSKWGLKLGNKGALVVVKIVAKAKKAERPVTKRWRCTVAAVTSVPRMCISLTGDVSDAVEAKKKTAIIVNSFLEAVLVFGKDWGGAVASWNNEVENELMYAGLAVKQVCTYVRYGLKISDFVIKHV